MITDAIPITGHPTSGTLKQRLSLSFAASVCVHVVAIAILMGLLGSMPMPLSRLGSAPSLRVALVGQPSIRFAPPPEAPPLAAAVPVTTRPVEQRATAAGAMASSRTLAQRHTAKPGITRGFRAIRGQRRRSARRRHTAAWKHFGWRAHVHRTAGQYPGAAARTTISQVSRQSGAAARAARRSVSAARCLEPSRGPHRHTVDTRRERTHPRDQPVSGRSAVRFDCAG